MGLEERAVVGLRLAQTERAPAPVFRSPIESLLDDLLDRHASLDGGVVASYIPELAEAEPDLFGIAVATTDGSLYEAGDARVPFTLQSISKPLTYALALERLGAEAVHARIGVEPSGDAFNSIALAPGSGMPSNAMVNAGAIAAASLVSEQLSFDDVLAAYGRFAGRPLGVDEQVYLSERETGHRNRAIAHLLRTFGIVGGNPEDGLDFYFRQCAVAVDCRDLALIGATLANGGVHPWTHERVIAGDTVREVLSVMASCGMYDGAGAWMTEIGLPAKSGVSGGILAALPGRPAVACYSPPPGPGTRREGSPCAGSSPSASACTSYGPVSGRRRRCGRSSTSPAPRRSASGHRASGRRLRRRVPAWWWCSFRGSSASERSRRCRAFSARVWVRSSRSSWT
jgi:glutaminase A